MYKRQALQLDVVSQPNKKCDPRVAYLWELPIVREFHVSNGAIARIIAADVGDEVVVALIETAAGTGASPFAFLDTAMELVESIEITPADPDAPATDATAAAEASEPEPAADTEPAATLNIILIDPGKDTIAVIKAVRAATGLGLQDAKDLVDGAPAEIGLGADEATEFVGLLEAAGAIFEVNPSAE